MIRELWDSQEENDTVEGLESSRKFHMDWNDWASGVGSYLLEDGSYYVDWPVPFVGEVWEGREYLRVSHRRSRALNNKTCEITISYTTKAHPRQERADELSSWDEELDIAMDQKTVTGFLPIAEGPPMVLDWKKIWVAEGPEGATEKNAPDLIDYTPRMTYTLTAIGSASYTARFIDYMRCVNAAIFLPVLDGVIKSYDSSVVSDVAGINDVGQWMFFGAQRKKKKPGVYQYRLLFIHDADGWNTSHGIYTGRYQSRDLTLLVSGMKNNTVDAWGGVR